MVAGNKEVGLPLLKARSDLLDAFVRVLEWMRGLSDEELLELVNTVNIMWDREAGGLLLLGLLYDEFLYIYSFFMDFCLLVVLVFAERQGLVHIDIDREESMIKWRVLAGTILH
jgi:hypothetical protein